jgi:hypothetical protein
LIFNKKLFVSFVMALLLATSFASLMETVHADVETTINLPDAITDSTVDHITINPAAASITAGSSINYTTTVYDQNGNSWDVTSIASYSVQGISITGNTVSETLMGNYTVTATYSGKSATATLLVYPALDHFVVSAPTSATTLTAFNLTVTAKDANGNTLTSYISPIALGASNGKISPISTDVLTEGVWTGAVYLSEAGSVTIYAIDGMGHSGTSSPITVVAHAPLPTSTPKPTATSTPTPTSNSTMPATTENGTTVELTITGNVTSAQVSNAVITADQSAAKTTISFTLTGETGTTGFSNLTIPRSAVPYGNTPTVYIDGQQVQNQGYTEDPQNFHVWFTAHFSTHQIEISFTGRTTQPLPWTTIAIVIVAIAVAIGILTVAMQKRKGKNQAAKKQQTTDT